MFGIIYIPKKLSSCTLKFDRIFILPSFLDGSLVKIPPRLNKRIFTNKSDFCTRTEVVWEENYLKGMRQHYRLIHSDSLFNLWGNY